MEGDVQETVREDRGVGLQMRCSHWGSLSMLDGLTAVCRVDIHAAVVLCRQASLADANVKAVPSPH